MKLEWLDNDSVQIDPPKKPKKLTGTRFATILGLNPWSTPFEVWCEVTRTYQKPFEDTIYTIAGKTIEPKQADYMKRSYYMPNLVTPTDIWGEDYFKVTCGDFFPESEVLGGMWDYKLLGKDGRDAAVLEMKTTKRSEDWAEKDENGNLVYDEFGNIIPIIPEYYALQAALYAYLLGVDNVIMVASFLKDSDYQYPDYFIPTAKNTVTLPFKVSERYPKFAEEYVAPALMWWDKYVRSGISPKYDEKEDAEILKALRTAHVDTTKESEAGLVAEAEALKAKIDSAKEAIAADEKRYKVITDGWKKAAIKEMATPGVEKVDITGSHVKWTLSKSESKELDIEAMKADGVYDKYLTKPKVTYTLRCGKV